MDSNKKILLLKRDIFFHQLLLAFTPYFFYKCFYADILLYETHYFTKYLYEKNINLRQEKVFSLEELKKFNGQNGNPPYVAVNNTVYDLSSISKWKNGSHFGLYAGNDLTLNFNTCHGNIKKLKSLPVVGILKN